LAEAVALGGGALGAAVEADMRSGAGAARRGEGKGVGAHLVERAVGTGVAENEVVEEESNEEAARKRVDTARRGAARVSTRYNSELWVLCGWTRPRRRVGERL